jgi:hypothetical protein
MLLENIFATALILFLFMLCFVCAVSRLNLWPNRRYDRAIMIVFLGSGAVTIITGILWIVRAWG